VRRSELDRQVLFEESDPTALDCAERLQFPVEQLRDFTEDGHGEHAGASVFGFCDLDR
jgi:hypothetical protein